MEKDKILVVEDELAIRKLIQFNLTRSNFDVIETAYGKQVPALIDAHHPALVVLDLGLPDIDGLELCAQIAETSPDTPIIIVSARDQDMEKIMGLELGADDYIVKPFNPLELVARIQSTLRRLRTMNPKQNAAAIHIGLFTVDLKTKRLSKSGKFIKLTSREFQLIDAEGNVLADSHKTAVKNVAQKEDVKKAAAHPAAASEIVNGEKVLSLTYPFLSNGSWTNAIRYTTSLTPVYTIFTENAVIVLAIGGAVIVTAALIGFLLARTIVTPLSQMTAAAEQMADGNFAARVPAGKSDELGKLSSTLNYMASQVEQHEKLKNEFIASVSHDLRTPLTSVKGWAITLHTVAEDEEMREGLEIIRDESERLSLLLSDLLDFSSLSSGSVSFRFETLDLQSILQQIAQQLSPRAEKSGIQLSFKNLAAPLVIEADKSRLYQLFINLLDNALKFTPDGGSITISAVPDNGFAAVRITDTGVGISADELDSVMKLQVIINSEQPMSRKPLTTATIWRMPCSRRSSRTKHSQKSTAEWRIRWWRRAMNNSLHCAMKLKKPSQKPAAKHASSICRKAA